MCWCSFCSEDDNDDCACEFDVVEQEAKQQQLELLLEVDEFVELRLFRLEPRLMYLQLLIPLQGPMLSLVPEVLLPALDEAPLL